jgi:hypothetical protein
MAYAQPALTEADRQRIADALKRAQVGIHCPMCGNRQFTVLDGYINHAVQTQLGGLVIGGQSVPTAVIVCNRCGFLSQHALGVLGLLPKTGAQP